MGKHVTGQSPWVMISPPGTTPSGMTPQDFLKFISNTSTIDSSISSEIYTKPSEIRTGEPGYLSKEWFDYIDELLAYLRETGHRAVFYDEVGFPSGMANHTTPKELYRKILEKHEETITGPLEYKAIIPEEGEVMAAVAMDIDHLRRINLTSLSKEGQLKWQVPEGEWKIMVFNCRTVESVGENIDYYAVTDYLDPIASKWFINTVYEPLYKEVGDFFGNTIFQTFYDDVGIYNEEKSVLDNFGAGFIQNCFVVNNDRDGIVLGSGIPVINNTVEGNRNMNTIGAELQAMVHTISGFAPEDIDNDIDLFSLGLDSLMLVDLRRKINGEYPTSVQYVNGKLHVSFSGNPNRDLGTVTNIVSALTFKTLRV